MKRPAESMKDWEKALELCPPENRDSHRAQRADSRLRAGLVAEAIAEVAELTKIENKNPGHWVAFARLYAIASVKIDGKKDEFAGRAVEMLAKGLALGYKQAATLATDADLAPLRERDDFKKLLAEVEKK